MPDTAAGRDAYSTFHSGGESKQVIGSKILAWSRNPDELIQNTVISNAVPFTDYFEAGAHLNKHGPFRTIADLEKKSMSVFVTKPLLAHIAHVGVSMNDYAILAPIVRCSYR